MPFLPEGTRIDSKENQDACQTLDTLQTAMEEGRILEGMTLLCTATHDLLISLGEFTGTIPREEVALGIREGTTKEIAILSRVGKPVSFVITAIDRAGETPILTLSRCAAQKQALAHLRTLPRGTILPAVVTHMESFGVFLDIGCGFVSMVSLEQISVSRISHPRDRFQVGQDAFVVFQGMDEQKGHVLLSHKELLGTWAENVRHFATGMTVSGLVRGIKPYGIFVELRPNLTGLAEYSPYIYEDQRVSVYIKSIVPERMKIKLLLIEGLEGTVSPTALPYVMTQGCVDGWQYAPEQEKSNTFFQSSPRMLAQY